MCFTTLVHILLQLCLKLSYAFVVIVGDKIATEMDFATKVL